tara:strand:+ start:521 stop:1159 length:639 start_codon:yes stop_codon:yes gene_type:complete
MNFNDTEQNLLDTWNKIQEEKKSGNTTPRLEFNFTNTLSDLIDTQVREEGGEGNPLDEEGVETFNAYNKLFNYEVDYGFTCSYTCNIGDYDHEDECDRDQLISYINGEDEPEEPDFLDKIYSTEWDTYFESNGDISPQIGVRNFKLKEIYQNITPKNVVAPIKETKKFQMVLEMEDHTEDNDFNAYAIGVKDYLNFADNGYKVLSAVVSSEE